MTTVRHAILFSFLESYSGLALNIVAFTLLARLLTPEQIGVYSVALAIVTVMQVLRDFGLVNFVIQKKDLNAEYMATVWGISLMLGASLFCVVQAAAPLIGSFYHNEAIRDIARVVALNFLLLPFNSVSLALLKREMQFKSVMHINVIAGFSGTLSTLLLAWLGWGALSLAIGSVVNSAAVALCLLLVGAHKQLGKPALSKAREVIAFGGQLTAANIITSVSMDINDIAVGKILGFHEVAIISRGQGLMNLFHRDFMNAVRNVAYPAFAQAHRDGEAVEAKYISAVTCVTAVAWPFYGFVSLFPLDIIRLMFGTQWDQAAPLVPYFCMAGAFSASISLIQTMMLALGHPKLVSLAEFIMQPIKALTLTEVIFWYRELTPFAIAFLIVAILSVPYFYYFKQKRAPTDFPALARKMGGNLLLAVVCLAPPAALAAWLRGPGAPLGAPMLIACATLSLALWLAALAASRHPLYLEAIDLLRRRRPAPAAAEQAV